jgi:hypothetical protein
LIATAAIASGGIVASVNADSPMPTQAGVSLVDGRR